MKKDIIDFKTLFPGLKNILVMYLWLQLEAGRPVKHLTSKMVNAIL